MTTDIRQQAEAAAKMIDEINAVVLPDPSADLIPLPQADAPNAEQIRARMAQIDMGDTNSIVSFGSSAQAELQQISQAMLQGVKNKDVGPAGDSLREIVGTIRGFSVDELDPNRKLSWWERLFGKAKPIHNFIAKYEQVQDQIDRITENLLSHEHAMMKDIKSLDLLYEKTLDFYHELALFIAAGEEK
ncbi:MAG: toxic anion resistance protein, partial [Proteobacteria bacterium]|nr:toxic anion resistance protein [Pseudomonadota bacterium]